MVVACLWVGVLRPTDAVILPTLACGGMRAPPIICSSCVIRHITSHTQTHTQRKKTLPLQYARFMHAVIIKCGILSISFTQSAQRVRGEACGSGAVGEEAQLYKDCGASPRLFAYINVCAAAMDPVRKVYGWFVRYLLVTLGACN